MTTRRASSVADFVASIPDIDDALVEDVRERLQSREVVKALQTLRIASGISQARIAEEIGCKQGRISKLENGFDDDLKLGDVEAYARVLDCGVRLQFTKRNETSFERIKRLAFCIHTELVRMAELANKDHDIAKGVAKAFGQFLYNQVRLLQIAAEKLPRCPTTNEEYIVVDFQSEECMPNDSQEIADINSDCLQKEAPVFS